MTEMIYEYDGSFEGFLTCIFESYAQKEVLTAISCGEDIPFTLFPVRTVLTDRDHAARVYRKVVKLSPEAADLLRRGDLVALPTETVYGIAADARNPQAVEKIFLAKGRPQDNPLIVHICGMEMLHGLVSEVPERALRLAEAFWPGPLTMVMPRGPEVADVTCAGLDTVGIRMPSHPVVQAPWKAVFRGY